MKHTNFALPSGKGAFVLTNNDQDAQDVPTQLELDLPTLTGRLEKWSIDDHYPMIWGQIYGDNRKRWPDGTMIHTSAIPNLSKLSLLPGDLVDTLNSTYLLGERE